MEWNCTFYEDIPNDTILADNTTATYRHTWSRGHSVCGDTWRPARSFYTIYHDTLARTGYLGDDSSIKLAYLSMPWLWRKTFGFKPFRGTLSSRGAGWSVGFSLLRIGVGPLGGTYISVRIPGTGISFLKYLGKAKRQISTEHVPPANSINSTSLPHQAHALSLSQKEQVRSVLPPSEKKDTIWNRPTIFLPC